MDEWDKYKNKFNLDKKPETEELYKILRNNVSQAIRRAKIKTFKGGGVAPPHLFLQF